MDPDRGAILAGPGEPVAVEEIVVDAPGPGEVRVRLAASGVCHTDLHVHETDGWGYSFPILLGHEGAGWVEDVGEDVDGLAAGDPVVLAWKAPCGECPACLRDAPRRCSNPLAPGPRLSRTDGSTLTPVLRTGTFATHTVVPAPAAIRMPEEIPLTRACLLGCGVATGVGAALWTVQVWPEANVAVIGCGAVGLSAIQGARLAGASEIVAVDLVEQKLEWARQFGATTAVTPDGIGRTRVDFAFDCVGLPSTTAQAIRLLSGGGTAVLVGVPPNDSEITLGIGREKGGFWDRRQAIVVCHGGDLLPAEDLPQLAQLYLDGNLDLDGMVTREIALEQVEDAFEAMKRGEVIRSVIVF